MNDFSFLKNTVTKKWLILAPRRAKRPDVANGSQPHCPFCPGKEREEVELYRIGGEKGDKNWEVRVIPNKFPFAPIHELVINTPDHDATFASFSTEHIERLLQVYRHRYNENSLHGQVYIFHNHGQKAGESIPHSHTQIVVIPDKVYLDVPQLSSVLPFEKGSIEKALEPLETSHFQIFCPRLSVWSDEVWIAPKKRKTMFGESSDDMLSDLAYCLSHLINIFDLRYNKDYPFNFYIHPDGDWYLRMIPRVRTLGGFEVGTNVFVNTQNPEETMIFIREQFQTPDGEKIMKEHQAEYHRTI